MKQLNNFIQEKLKLNKDSKISEMTKLDLHNTDMMIDILKASFIGLYKQHFEHKNDPFKQAGLSTYSIRKTQVDYENIVNILNNYYNYSFDIEEIKDKNSDLYKIIHYYLTPLGDLINMKKVNIKCCGGLMNGYDIYWEEWKKYVKENNIKA